LQIEQNVACWKFQPGNTQSRGTSPEWRIGAKMIEIFCPLEKFQNFEIFSIILNHFCSSIHFFIPNLFSDFCNFSPGSDWKHHCYQFCFVRRFVVSDV